MKDKATDIPRYGDLTRSSEFGDDVHWTSRVLGDVTTRSNSSSRRSAPCSARADRATAGLNFITHSSQNLQDNSETDTREIRRRLRVIYVAWRYISECLRRIRSGAIRCEKLRAWTMEWADGVEKVRGIELASFSSVDKSGKPEIVEAGARDGVIRIQNRTAGESGNSWKSTSGSKSQQRKYASDEARRVAENIVHEIGHVARDVYPPSSDRDTEGGAAEWNAYDSEHDKIYNQSPTVWGDIKRCCPWPWWVFTDDAMLYDYLQDSDSPPERPPIPDVVLLTGKHEPPPTPPNPDVKPWRNVFEPNPLETDPGVIEYTDKEGVKKVFVPPRKRGG